MSHAVIVCGSPWWGDASRLPDGTAVSLENPASRRENFDRANAEMLGAAAEIEALPDDCYVIHTAERGAAASFAIAAAKRRLPMIVVPRPALIDVVAGLGWKMKVLAAGDTPDGLVAELRGLQLFVKSVERWVEPDPVSESEAPA